MTDFKTKTVILVVLSLCSLLITSCAMQQTQQPVYDPLKQYAGFLLVNSPSSSQALEKMKQVSVAEGFETGQVLYYNSGTTDFAPLLKKLTSSPQVSLLWIASRGLMEMRDIQSGMAKVGFKGSVRYMPAAGSGEQ